MNFEQIGGFDKKCYQSKLYYLISILAKDIIVQHVRSVHLGRRNFHYLMSGLVLDDYWDSR